jgi:hypothetical protein
VPVYDLPAIDTRWFACSNNGVAGTSTTGNGVFGVSNTNVGVLGCSTTDGAVVRTGVGVLGQSTSNWGVGGTSDSGAGVVGTSNINNGVAGTSTSGNGVAGFSTKGPGLWATGTPAGFFQGNVTVTGNITAQGDIFLAGADCAEQFDLAGNEQLAPGTVVVIDQDGCLRESLEPYDRTVAGVVSGAGEYRPGIVLNQGRPKRDARPLAAVALVGRVYCKVDAGYSAITFGDLLTTSPTPGHAMKASNPTRAFGAVLGKALRSLAEGQDMIPILVALQ